MSNLNPKLEKILSIETNTNKAIGISTLSNSLDQAIELLQSHCEALINFDWIQNVDVLYIVLHIPNFRSYLPALNFDMPNYKHFSKLEKLKTIMTFEMYFKILYLDNNLKVELVELANRFYKPGDDSTYFEDCDFFQDLMIYSNWEGMDELCDIARKFTKKVFVPPHLDYKARTIVAESPESFHQNFENIRVIFPDLSNEEISYYLGYFSEDVERLVNAGLEQNFPPLPENFSALKPLKANETRSLMEKEISSAVPEDVKKSVLNYQDCDMYDDEREANFEELIDTLGDLDFHEFEYKYSEQSRPEDSNSVDKKLLKILILEGEGSFHKDARSSANRRRILKELNWTHEQFEGWFLINSRIPGRLERLKMLYKNQNLNLKNNETTEPQMPTSKRKTRPPKSKFKKF
eukprot:NODE_798_length_3838_cov_0.446911.p2 type:complete len:406 gc:universal NODE_798_length_3838_cov_0.446911:1386-169(-)